ncbi:MAG TPA: type II toxin-antitoxin system RelE/ParE family toxin [Gaiellaceae bacterium]|jgi:hypothetical protein|nr:type II toxin-antitoxin system RelE/ParE family toxin [Gaiellaceae bacterium]
MWEVEVTDEFRDWYEDLDEDSQAPIIAAVKQLEQRGPSLPRPIAAEVVGSRIHNLKELRPLGTSIRILFVFDPRRSAILLIGVDKAEQGWNEWYDRVGIPAAERLYDDYLAELRREGLIE